MEVISNDIGKELVDILELPPNTKSIEIRFASGEAVTVRGQFYMNQSQVRSFFGFLEDHKYKLVKNEGAKNEN